LKKYFGPLGIPFGVLIALIFEKSFHKASVLPAAPSPLGDGSPPAVDPVEELTAEKISKGRENFRRHNQGNRYKRE